jgi:hypothetical protein
MPSSQQRLLQQRVEVSLWNVCYNKILALVLGIVARKLPLG